MSVGLLLLAVLVAAAACSRNDDPGPDSASRSHAWTALGSATGMPVAVDPIPLPAFERVTAVEDTFRTSDHRGRVLAVNFWATWCGPCIREIPELMALQSALGDSGLTVVGVSLDHGGFEIIHPFLEPFRPNYPVVLDEGLGSELGGILGLPATFLVDRFGEIVIRVDGLIRPRLFRREVQRLLSGRAVAPHPTPPSGRG